MYKDWKTMEDVFRSFFFAVRLSSRQVPNVFIIFIAFWFFFFFLVFLIPQNFLCICVFTFDSSLWHTWKHYEILMTLQGIHQSTFYLLLSSSWGWNVSHLLVWCNSFSLTFVDLYKILKIWIFEGKCWLDGLGY